MKYTHEQRLAMELRDRNLLVSAAAGAGKTSVLVERIVGMATDTSSPVDLDRMLVVTFTNAAAAEMKERIRLALYRELKKAPYDKNIRRQTVLLNHANVSTIHSFCSDVIRNNYHLLDTDPAFRVADEMESSLVLRKAMDEVVCRKYETAEEGFSMLVDTIGRGRDDSALFDTLMKLYAFMRSMPDYLEWLDDAVDMFSRDEQDFGKTIWGRLITDYARTGIRGLRSELSAAGKVNEDIGGPPGYSETIGDDIAMLSEVMDVLEEGNWDKCSDIFRTTCFQKSRSAPRGTPDELKMVVQGARKRAKGEFSRIASFFTGSSDEIISNTNLMHPMFRSLADIMHETDGLYMELKRGRGILDYNDLEHMALEALSGSAGEFYRRKFIEIFVDEYQDSNPIQDRIISLVSGRDREEGNVFMVGDLKQSIYGFRHAMPDLFLSKYESFSQDPAASEVRVELSDNYRSRREIIDFTNVVFDSLMTKDSCNIDYRGNARLSKKAEYDDHPGYGVEIKVVCTDRDDIFEPRIKKEHKEAAVAGREILKLIESGLMITDRRSNQQRKVDFRDITILMRSPKGSSDKFAEQLSQMGIPVNAAGSSDFFGAYEISVVLDYLRIIDNPRQDIPLLAVLRSSMYGFTDRELAEARFAYGGRGRYYDCLLDYDGRGALREKIASFLEKYEDYRNMSYSTDLDKFIWTIMTETGFYNRPVHSVSTESAQSNLRRLFDLASSYEKSGNTGIQGFLIHVDNMRKSGTDVSPVAPQGDSNRVNIMSIHGSKGLEFPVVILAGTGRQFNRSESKEPLVWDRKYGFGPDYVNYDEGFKITTAAKKSLRAKGIIEDTREEMRILYVAMTRAREKLIITGGVRNLQGQSLKWVITGMRDGGGINSAKILGASSQLEWIMACLCERKSGRIIPETAGVLTGREPAPDEADFGIEYILPADILDAMASRRRHRDEGPGGCRLSYEEICSRFAWRYPYEAERGIHRKVSVTELKKMRDKAEGGRDIFGYDLVERPSFMNEEGGIGAARRGTLLHNILAAIDYSKAGEEGYIRGLVDKTGAAGAEADEYYELMERFLSSPLGLRARKAGNTATEKSFLRPIRSTRVYPEKEGIVSPGHTVLLQGIIDCMFIEDGSIIIIDYKSDNVRNGHEKEQAEKYRLQLELYSEAARGLTGLPVGGMYIYFLKTGVGVEL